MWMERGKVEYTALGEHVRAVGNASISSAQEPKAVAPSVLKFACGGEEQER
jgi:hypothetical protein